MGQAEREESAILNVGAVYKDRKSVGLQKWVTSGIFSEFLLVVILNLDNNLNHICPQLDQ
jgi:hypothetical protein